MRELSEWRSRQAQRCGSGTCIYDTFTKITKLESLPDKPAEEIPITYIIAGLRSHLGITELTKLRKHFLEEATKRLK